MLANGSRIRRRVEGPCSTPMGTNMMAFGTRIKSQALEFTSLPIMTSILAVGGKTRETAMGSSLRLIRRSSRVTGSTTKKRVLEAISFWPKKKSSLESGKMTLFSLAYTVRFLLSKMATY